MKHMTCQPIEGTPDVGEVFGLTELPPIAVTMVTYCDPRTGDAVWLKETYTDPDSGLLQTFWSRVTTSLAYVRGPS